MLSRNLEKIKEYYLEHEPFTDENNTPEYPCCKNEEDQKWFENRFIELGAIPKSEMVEGCTYVGACRNASFATWKGEYFEYERYKFGIRFKEKINHFQDDDGYDVFVPVKKID